MPAVPPARGAFAAWSATAREERVAALERIATEFERRLDDMGVAIREEMGAPQSKIEIDQYVSLVWLFKTRIDTAILR